MRQPPSPASHTLASRIAVRFILFALVWLILTGADWSSWPIGIPAIAVATGLSIFLASPDQFRLRLAGVLVFLPWFLLQSFLSGFDVMRLALAPHLTIEPGVIPYTTHLPDGPAQILFMNSISLLPGTLSARLQGNEITIHILDSRQPVLIGIQRLEQYVAACFHPASAENRTRPR